MGEAKARIAPSHFAHLAAAQIEAISDTKNIYNGCRKNAVVEASDDRPRS